ERIGDSERTLRYVADMRYYRQGYELAIEIESVDVDLRELAESFRAAHHRLYGFSLPGAVELVNLRARAVGTVAKPELKRHDPVGPDPLPAQIGVEEICSGGERIKVPLYERALLQAGMLVSGPAVAQQYDATTLVLPGHPAP